MENQEFSYRLRVLIGEVKSLNKFAKKSGITESLMRNYVQGKSLPGLDKLITIAKTANVEINWLATGEGEMRRGEGEKQTVAGCYVILEDNKHTVIDEPLLEAAIAFVETYEQLLDDDRYPPSRKAETVMKMCRKWVSDGTYVKGDTAYDILGKVGIKDAYDNLENQYKRRKCPADN